MTNTDSNEIQNKQKLISTIALIIIFASFIGIIDAGYLTITHFRGEIPTCSEGFNCEAVTTSKYSSFFGIPVALFGMLYYLSIFILSICCFDTNKKKYYRILPKLSIIGLLASIYFVFLQLVIIKEICLYCMISAATSTVIFLLAMTIYYFMRTKKCCTDIPSN